MILNAIAWGWDKALVDKQTAREIVPTPAQVAPPPEARPPAGDPVITMMNEFLESSLGRHAFLEKKRQELQAKFGSKSEFVENMLNDLENMIQRHRETESRGPR